MKKEFIRGFYFITDSSLSKNGIQNDVICAINSGVKIVQYREKQSSTRKMYQEAIKLKEILRDAILIINDRVDICLAVEADGVHIGMDDMPLNITRRLVGKNRIIGVSVHNVKEALESEESGADYVAVSPIFQTTTKPDALPPVGLEILRNVKEAVSIPVVAIGGINLENAASVINAGADAICAISASLKTGDVGGEIQKFNKLFSGK